MISWLNSLIHLCTVKTNILDEMSKGVGQEDQEEEEEEEYRFV